MEKLKELTVSGIQHLVNRAFGEGHELQYLRELVVNALEAGATRVEFGPEWRAVEESGVYRLMVADNGRGMLADELQIFLTTFGGGGKPIGGSDENFGVGAKTSLLPWNPEGVVVLSWTAEDPAGAMLWLARDPKSGAYGARLLQDVDGGWDTTIRPAGLWARVRPAWLEHGTVVVCLGATGREHTLFGRDGTASLQHVANYLNHRLWEVPPGVEISSQEMRSTKQKEWPRSYAEATTPTSGDGVDRRWNRRVIRGAHHYLTDVKAPKGELAAQGVLKLADKAEVAWYLWTGTRPAIHSYAEEGGYIAALYKGELYDVTTHGARFRSFGITHAEVRRNLSLIVRPPSDRVYPDTARNTLKVAGPRGGGSALPWDVWAEEFASNLPAPIAEVLAKAGPQRSGTIHDPSWQQRIIDKFGSQWRTLRYVHSEGGGLKILPERGPGSRGARGDGEARGEGDEVQEGEEGQVGAAGEVQPEKPRVASEVSPKKRAEPGKAVHALGGLPDYVWTELKDTDETGVYPVAWYPKTADHPNGVIQLARDWPMFRTLKRHWRAQYPDHLGEEVDAIIEEVYGESLVARVAHSEHLVHDPAWGRPRVEELRGQPALTASLLGLLSEDSVIASRMGRLGVRKRSAA